MGVATFPDALAKFAEAMGATKPVISIGDRVITWWSNGVALYGGESDSTGWQLEIGIGSGGPGRVFCPATMVAPEGTPIPERDARVDVQKLPSLRPGTWVGPWRSVVPTLDGGTFTGWHRTKSEGTADSLRRLAIHDFHKPEVVEHLPLGILSPDGEGVRSTARCSCGDGPTKGAAGGREMFAWMNEHIRTVGAPPPDYSQMKYAPGYAAAGMAWNQWYATSPNGDPFAPATS